MTVTLSNPEITVNSIHLLTGVASNDPGMSPPDCAYQFHSFKIVQIVPNVLNGLNRLIVLNPLTSSSSQNRHSVVGVPFHANIFVRRCASPVHR